MACEDTRQLTEAQRQAAYQQQRTGVQQAVRPFTGTPTLDNLIDYINRELQPAVKATRKAANDIYLQVADNAPSANPLGYYFSTETGAADPTVGRVRLNASPQSGSTVLRISQTNGRLVDVLPWLDVMNGSVTVPLGVVTLADAINPGRFLRADLDTMVDQGAYWDLGITITEASHPDPFVDAEAVTLAFIPGVADNGGLGAQIPPGSITPIPTDTFLGNISGADANPVAVPLASIDSTSITYDGTAHEFRRSALTGFAEAAANTNATTSAEPLISYSASSNMSAERVATSSTSVAVSTSVASQVEWQRAALTGDVAATLNSNATTIQPDVVDNTKLANMAQARIKGRASGAGTGDPTDLTGAQVATVSGGWPGALAAVVTTGANNPQIDAAQYIQFGSGAVPASGQLRSSATILTRSTAAVEIIGGTGVSATATTGALTLAASAGSASLTATGALSTASLVSTNSVVSLTAGNAIVGTAGASISLTANGGNATLATTGINNVALAAANNAVTIDAATVINLTTGGTLRLSMEADGSWNIGGSNGTAGQALVSAGASAPPAWGSIALTALPSIADDTFLANISGGAAAPTAVALTTLAGAGLTGGADAILAVGAGTGITVNANDVAITTNGVTNALLRQSGALSVIGRSANSTGNAADIATTSGSADVLRESGGVLGFGQVATAGLADNSVDDDKLRNSVGPSVIGRASNTTGNPSDIIATTNDRVLARVANALDYVQVGTALLADASVTPIKIAPGIHTLVGAGPHTDIAIADTVTTILCETTTTINSIAGGWSTRRLSVITDGGNTLNVNHGSGASGNQIALPDAVSYSQLRGGMLIEYDTSTGTGVWRIVATAEGLVPLSRMANLAQSTIIGRAEGAGTGVPQALTPTQVIAIVDGESPTWTGSHSFMGPDFTVDVSDDVSIEAADDIIINSGSLLDVDCVDLDLDCSGTGVISAGNLILTANTTVDINSPHQLNNLSALTNVQTTSTAGAINNLAVNCNVLRLTGAGWSLTGMVPWTNGAMVLIVNASALVGTLQGEDAGSTAANRFAGIDHVITTGQAALCWYDGTLARWHKH